MIFYLLRKYYWASFLKTSLPARLCFYIFEKPVNVYEEIAITVSFCLRNWLRVSHNMLKLKFLIFWLIIIFNLRKKLENYRDIMSIFFHQTLLTAFNIFFSWFCCFSKFSLNSFPSLSSCIDYFQKTNFWHTFLMTQFLLLK